MAGEDDDRWDTASPASPDHTPLVETYFNKKLKAPEQIPNLPQFCPPTYSNYARKSE